MTYKNLMEKYSRAMDAECYFEAILIDYAMLEDRMRSYLYHIGCLETRLSYRYDNEAIQGDIEAILTEFSGKEVQMPDISMISGKINILKKLNSWAVDGFPHREQSAYLKALAECMDGNVDPQDMLDKLKDVKDWCDYRNEVVHSLLNKNLASLYVGLAGRAEEGMALARFVDGQVRKIKRKSQIRSLLGLSL